RAVGHAARGGKAADSRYPAVVDARFQACLPSARARLAWDMPCSPGETPHPRWTGAIVDRSGSGTRRDSRRRMRTAATAVQAAGLRRRRTLLVVGIVVVAFNLRPTLASVGPLVGEIQAETGLSHAALGLLTTLPLLAFGAVSNLAPGITRAFGVGGALGVALSLIVVGGAARGLGSALPLFGGTIVLGTGIALGNVLLPAIVKRDFPGRSGSMTSLYSSVMALGASLAAGISYPLTRYLGWRGV